MSVSPILVKQAFQEVIELGAQKGTVRDLHFFEAPGFVGVDVNTSLDDTTLRALGNDLINERVHRSELHPDAWVAMFVRDPADTETRMK